MSTDVLLSKDQKNALKLLENGENVFLTGEAGTGKSFLLNFYLSRNKSKRNILITAPTGIAAINIGGTTLHRAFHAPLEPSINTKVNKVPKAVKSADTIIIDEISMCRIDLFEFVMRTISLAETKMRTNKQVIVVGDFFQLSPVVTNQDREILSQAYPESEKFYCFESKLWADRNFKIINLEIMMRQNDPILIQELNKARKGDVSCINFFNKRVTWDKDPQGITLCATNKEADKINKEEIDKLKGKLYKFKAGVTGNFTKSEYPTLETLSLKLGMRVMTIRNGKGYLNGSLGYVNDISSEQITVELDNGKFVDIGVETWENLEYTTTQEIDEWGNKELKLETSTIGKFIQFPLKPAYAITMHKSQGQTFEKVNLIPYSFAAGQLYVALSRVTTLNGLRLLTQITSDYLKCDDKVLEFYNKYIKSDEDTEKNNELMLNLAMEILKLPDDLIELFSDDYPSISNIIKKIKHSSIKVKKTG